MKAGPLTKVSVAIATEAEEAVMALLSELFGEPASAYTNAETGRTTASVYLENEPDEFRAERRALLEGLRQLRSGGLDIGTGKISATKLRREDWAESWKRHFKPIEIGDVLLIKPSWSNRQPRRAQAVVVLDPGLSFGTGQHPTTRFCLEQLVAVKKQDSDPAFLDIGTGSGILAIAAAKLGYWPVEAFDIDPDAVRIARFNARQNGVARKLRLNRQDLTRLPMKAVRQYDLVCANLVCDLLLDEQRRILACLKPTGSLVLAGILATQFPAARRAYQRAGLRLVARRAENEWESGAFVWK
jgi:ribosomal protein L11 methyltransferase